MGYPKLREEWVINALCDAQDWGRSECAPGLCPGPTALRCLLHSQHKANGMFQRLVPEHPCSVLSAARAKEGAAAQMSLKMSISFLSL